MAKRMLIDATHPEETRVVILNGNRLDEFDFESSTKKQIKGNIYLAKITRVEPSLQAAFVDFGGNRHGFLPFGEIHPDYYQIPVADRQALLAVEEAEVEDEERAQPRGRRRGRRGDSRRDGSGEGGPAAAGRAGDGEGDGDEGGDRRARGDSDEDGGAALDRHGDDGHGNDRGGDDGDGRDRRADDHHDHEGGGGDDARDGDDIAREAAERDRDRAEQARAERARELAEDDDTLDDDASGDGAPRRPMLTDEGLAREAVSGPLLVADARPDEEGEADEAGRAASSRADAGEDLPAGTGDGNGEPTRVETLGGDEVDEMRRRRPRLARHYKIQEVIKRRQIILVQVTKEERGTKGAALTTYLSLAGRYGVLMPNSGRGGGVSRKIVSPGDRRRLKSIIEELQLPDGMSVIVRTAGSERTKPEIKRDCEYLLRLWEEIRELTMRSSAPALIYEEGKLIKRAIRDLYSRDIEEILVDGEEAYREAKDFMRVLMPSHAKRVQPYRDGGIPLFQRFQVDQQIDLIHNPTVQLRSGGYIVINPTEALVAIDVNSGRATRERNIEETAYKTNLEASDEIARQLRLRDLAGLIVIDFIDMEETRNQIAVERRLKEAMRTDRARIQIGRISPFGLLELSRQRLRPSLIETSTQPCPHCGGTGFIRSVESTALQVLRAIEEEGVRRRSLEIRVVVPTAVALYILNHKRATLAEIETRYVFRVMIDHDHALVPPNFTLERVRARPVGEAPPPLVTHQPIRSRPDEDALRFSEEEEEDEAAADAAVEMEDAEEAEEAAPAAQRRARDAAPGEEDEDGRRRRRRRRRRGRREGGEEEGQRTDHEAAPTPAGEDASGLEDQPEGAPIQAGESDDDSEDGEGEGEGGREAGRAGAEGEGDGGDRRRRRRGRRGGRRRRRSDEAGGGDGSAGQGAVDGGQPPRPVAAERPPGPVAVASVISEPAQREPMPSWWGGDAPTAAPAAEPPPETTQPETTLPEPAMPEQATPEPAVSADRGPERPPAQRELQPWYAASLAASPVARVEPEAAPSPVQAEPTAQAEAFTAVEPSPEPERMPAAVEPAPVPPTEDRDRVQAEAPARAPEPVSGDAVGGPGRGDDPGQPQRKGWWQRLIETR